MARKLRTHLCVCEQCGIHFERTNTEMRGPRFCGYSCSNKWQHAHGIRRAYVADKTTDQQWEEKYSPEEVILLKKARSEKQSTVRRGKTNVEYYGEEKAAKLHALQSLSWEERYGTERANAMKKHQSEVCPWNGKSVEERLGTEKAAETRAKAAKTATGRKHTTETKKLQSEAVIGRIQYLPNSMANNAIKGWYKNNFFRSSYEYSFMKKLEADGLSLDTDVYYEEFRIPYQFHGKERTYIPDFFVPKQRIVYEIKASWALKNDDVVAKYKAATEFFLEKQIEYQILTEKDFRKQSIKDLKLDPDVKLLDKNQSEKLDYMFYQQYKFMKLLQRKRNFPQFPVDLTTKVGQKIVKDIMHDGMHELFEAIVLLKNVKDHRVTEMNDIDREHFLEELVDAQHYFVEVCILCGISSRELFTAFMEKGRVNIKRILSGY